MQRAVRRHKEYRWTSPVIPINSGAEVPDGKLYVDSDADFEWMAYKWWITDASNTFLYRLYDSKMRPLQSDEVPGVNDFSFLGGVGGGGSSAPEFGYGVATKVLNPYRVIPAGQAITIQVEEYTGQDVQNLWLKLSIIGRKVYRF